MPAKKRETLVVIFKLKLGMKLALQEVEGIVEGIIVIELPARYNVDALFDKLAGKDSLSTALLEDRAQEKQCEKAVLRS